MDLYLPDDGIAAFRLWLVAGVAAFRLWLVAGELRSVLW